MRSKATYIVSLILLLGVVFILRLAINNSSPLLNTVSRWILFIGSIGVVFVTFAFYRKELITFFKPAKDIQIVVFALLLMEASFMIKNAQLIGLTYVFGLLLSLILWVILYALLPPKISHILGYFTLILFGIYVMGQDLYYRIFDDFFSFKEALTLREGIESGEGMIKISFFHVWMIAILVVSLDLLTRHLKNDYVTHLKLSKKYLLFLSSMILMFCVLLNLNTRIPLTNQTIFTSDHYLYQTVFSKTDFTRRYGLFHFLGRDLFDTFEPRWHTSSDVKMINDYFQSNEKQLSTHDFVGQFENKNLIFILAESYDEITLDPELTPHLYRLKTEGIDFSNHYTPVFQRTTSDTEFIFNTGLIPSIEDGPTISVYKQNSYRISLANLFKNKGYAVNAFHGNYKEFYGRDTIYENYGYDHFYGRDELGLSPDDGRFDTLFFHAAKDLIVPTTTPFMSFIITFSGHSPYSESHEVALTRYEDVLLQYPNDHGPLSYYRATQVELDKMVGMLLDDLEEKQLLDDTLIVLSGDHYPYTLPQDIYEETSGISEGYLKHRGNLYLWGNQISPYQVSKQTTSFDILPTLNTLFNLGGDQTYYVGHDMFTQSITPVLYKHYAYYDGTSYQLLNATDVNNEMMQHIARQYIIYKKILRTNYFK